MKKSIIFLAVVVVTVVALLWGSPVARAGLDVNPADYTVNVHVSTSRLVIEPGSSAYRQKLIALIDGKKCELEGSFSATLLALGDYKAKLVEDQHKSAYDSIQVYEFAFPDNKTAKFRVVGLSE